MQKSVNKLKISYSSMTHKINYLSPPNLLHMPHSLDVPKERRLTLGTYITVLPLHRLQHININININNSDEGIDYIYWLIHR